MLQIYRLAAEGLSIYQHASSLILALLIIQLTTVQTLTIHFRTLPIFGSQIRQVRLRRVKHCVQVCFNSLYAEKHRPSTKKPFEAPKAYSMSCLADLI